MFCFFITCVANYVSFAWTWTSLVKRDLGNYFVAQHVTESLIQNLITQSNDANVFIRIDLERKNLLRKYRGFSTYIENEMKIYAS